MNKKFSKFYSLWVTFINNVGESFRVINCLNLSKLQQVTLKITQCYHNYLNLILKIIY